jgi:hypothetical protein
LNTYLIEAQAIRIGFSCEDCSIANSCHCSSSLDTYPTPNHTGAGNWKTFYSQHINETAEDVTSWWRDRTVEQYHDQRAFQLFNLGMTWYTYRQCTFGGEAKR